MIQFNLLPDVKIAFIKALRQKRLVIFVSTVASIAAVVLFVLLFSFVNVVQKKSMNDLTDDIDKMSANLMETKDLNKILTIQNQLKTLGELHDKKVVATRLFGYAQQVTPSGVSISSLDVDFGQNTLVISGSAPSLVMANTFADSLKFTKFTAPSTGEEKKAAFSNVVLSSFSAAESKVSYTFNVNYDPALFSQAEEVTLEVPKMITTRSQTELPGAVFQDDGGNE